MREKRVLRYYCDHCKKSGRGKTAIRKHEQGCTRNPERICGFCRHAENEQQPITTLITAMRISLPEARKVANDCPACLLAAIIQGKFNEKPDEESHGRWVEFDFKAEVKQFWEDHKASPS